MQRKVTRLICILFEISYHSIPIEYNINMMDHKIFESFAKLSEEVKELNLNTEVPEIEGCIEIDPLKFLRNWIAPNRPVIIKNASKNWPAFQKWNNNYLREKIGETSVTVSVTPNGYADAPYKNYFALPEDRLMKFKNFLDIIEHKVMAPGVFYVQKQNSNLTDEFSSLLEDVPSEISWFTKALGKHPDAVNFWMGDCKAVTSMHKDNYENLYYVIRGYKDFILLPPTDLPWVPYQMYRVSQFKSDYRGTFVADPLPGATQVPWICIDPLKPNLELYPQYKNASPLRCRLYEGDALYLPSLWFHHVQQSHGCIAVNYWYDMEYDLKYCYYQMLQKLSWNFLSLESS